MCNHYRQYIRKGVEIPGWSSGEFSEIRIPLRFDNLPVDVYPDKPGLVLRQQGDGLQFTAMRWGFPKVENQWVTNARNVMNRTGPAPFWADWTGPEYRCVVPASSFLEFDVRTRGQARMTEVEFARADGLPFFFAGIWRPWTGLRGTKKEPVEGDHEIYAFLTTSANGLMKPIHPKAMPVILTSWEEAEVWLNEPIDQAITLQRPLAEDQLVIVEKPITI